jgi:hypothetical protein
VRKQLNETQNQSKSRRDQANAEMGAKLKVLQDQAKGAGDRAKARIERRISDLKKNFDLHSKKLSQTSAS